MADQRNSIQFLCLLSSLERWRVGVHFRWACIHGQVGMLRLKSAVMLEPVTEYLVRGRLPPLSGAQLHLVQH